MKRAIVTGANGFIGSALVQELANNDTEVIALDLYNNNIPVDDRIIFVRFDMNDMSAVTKRLSELKPDLYYHLAWFGMNGKTRGDPSVQLKNVVWTLDALRQAEEIGCKRFVGAGSIMEYETYYAVIKQGNKPGINYTYGAAKPAARALCMIQGAKIGIETVWAEITNAYGAGENSPRLINSTLRKILDDEPLEFTSGTQNYDFVYITDVARAFRLIGENGKPFCHYIVGSSDAKPLREFLTEIKNAVAPKKDFIFGNVEFTGVNLPLEVFDGSVTEKDTGFRPKIPFETGIKLTMDWIKNN